MRPIFQTSAFVFEADIPEHTAEKMIKKLRDSGLFRVLRQAKGCESAVVAFRDLLNITEGSEVF
jgi:surfactin synthase thioesterase subunit